MAPWELEQLPLSPSVYPCMNTSLYLCLHVPACARRGVLTLTNPLKDRICYQREHYLFLGFSSHARSVSLRPPLTLNFFLYFSLYHSLLRVFFPSPLPLHSDTLRALGIPSDKGPAQGPGVEPFPTWSMTETLPSLCHTVSYDEFGLRPFFLWDYLTLHNFYDLEKM